jgi:LacI family transcriptional regulator
MCRVAHHATQRGWHLDLRMCLTNEVPATWSGDGIITTQSGDNEKVRTLLTGSGCPVVSLNMNSHPHGIPCVAFDLPAASRLAVDHFMERGFRRFAFYCRPNHDKILYSTQIALSAFRQQIEASDHTCETFNWMTERGATPDTWENRQKWLQMKLQEAPKPLALFAHEPECALEVIEACLRKNLHIPDQVAVLCMHGIEFFNQCSPVPLSSIDVDNEAKARTACDLLEAMMNGAPVPAALILIPPKGITVRASTDTLAASDPAVMKAIRYMFDHCASNFSTVALLGSCGLSRTGLFRAFRADLGQTPRAVLTRIRLDKAKDMLHETDAKLSDVASACGFGHQVSLHVHFKKAMNMSPGAYRRHSRQASEQVR